MQETRLWITFWVLSFLAQFVIGQNISEPRVPAQQGLLVIKNISIIDVMSGAIHDQRTVLIDHGRIVSIGDGADSGGHTEIDGRGKYLIPGLWDAHVHVTEEDGRFLPLYLRFGMTSVIDKGGYLEKLLALRAALASGEEIGPRLFMAGRPIDGDPVHWPKPYPKVPIVVHTEEEARAAVHTNQQAGANYIKLYGALIPDHLIAAADEAHKLGLKTTTDLLTWIFAPEVAMDAHIDAFEHAIPSGFKYGTPGEYSYAAEEYRLVPLLRTMKDQNVALTSTVTSMLLGNKNQQEKATFQALPPQLQKRALEMQPNFPLTPVAQAYFQRKQEYLCKCLKVFAQDGGLVMAGTDSFWQTNYPGDVHDELQQLVACGLSPLQALQTATMNPAKWLGRQDLGTIKPGSHADLLILDSNPLSSIDNTRKISGVILEGRYFDHTALAALSRRASQPITLH